MFAEFDDTDINLKDEESSSDDEAPKNMGIGKVYLIKLVKGIVVLAKHW